MSGQCTDLVKIGKRDGGGMMTRRIESRGGIYTDDPCLHLFMYVVICCVHCG